LITAAQKGLAAVARRRGGSGIGVGSRYWRWLATGTNKDGTHNFSFYELEFYQSVDCSGSNLALGKTAIGSQGDVSNTLANLIDGDDATRWSLNDTSGPGWAGVDFGERADVNSMAVRLYLGDRYPQSSVIQKSNDGESWETVASLSGSLFVGPTQFFTHLNTLNPLQGTRIHGHMVSASSDRGGDFPAVNAFDGVILDGSQDNIWMSSSGTQEWFQWDFGEVATVNKWRYSSRNRNAYRYDIKDYWVYSSPTGVFGGEETLVHSGSFPTLAQNALSDWSVFPSPVDTRYLRILMDGHNSSNITVQDFVLE
jgi:hypothetical protein